MSERHEPTTPAWECRDCGQSWPCPSRRQLLLREYGPQPASLSVYLAACLAAATADLPTPPADLQERFLGWIPHPRHRAF